MNIPFVDLKSQYESIKGEIDAAISDVLVESAFVGGPFLEKFEQAFARFCGTRHCIGVGNGTDAIYIALRALGIGSGDEVITAANSFIATSEAITMAGARVVFADVDPQTYNLDVTKLAGKITPRTRAIIPIHLYGQPADMDPILELASKYNLKVIEDAAQAHGALYRGRKVGKLGDVACFSFYPSKNLGAYGDGGAIVTDDDAAAEVARMFINHGSVEKYNHTFEGVNSRLDDLQAAILSAKLNHLEGWTEKRRINAYLYNDHLKDIGLITPVEIEGVRAVYHLYVVRVDKEKRPALSEYLKSRGIGTGIHYPIALPNLKAYEHLGCKKDDFPEATRASEEILSLPMFPELNEDQIIHVRNAIYDFFNRS
jgi:dTDP-4-amino-4,6-dideoxygalactose transaminase